MTPKEREVKNTIDKIVKGLEAKDVRLIEDAYAHDPDLVIFPEGPELKVVGWEAHKQAIEDFLADYTNVKSVVHDDYKVVVGEDMSLFCCTYTLSGRDIKSNKDMSWTGRSTFFLQKREAKWVIVHEHSSLPVTFP